MVEVIEAGTGPLVVLVHSSVAGARQWRRLMADLEDRYHLIAVNLYGYGGTPPWTAERKQTLADQADLVLAAVADPGPVRLIGHSFGGTVAMKAAAALGPRARQLILFEPNPFPLLAQHGHLEAFAEVADLRDVVRHAGVSGDWSTASQRFADYWGGAGTWQAMADERRATFMGALPPVVHEWDAVMDGTPLEVWARVLPADTVVIATEHAVRPIREIVALMRAAGAPWRFEQVAGAGHMAPLTRPDLVNPLLAALLDEARTPPPAHSADGAPR
jgi:pimeloyl-ACP methyl ester carboxylesterase